MTRPRPIEYDDPLFAFIESAKRDWARDHTRTTDPVTSHLAAESMQASAAQQHLTILGVLRRAGKPLTAWGVAAGCGLDYVQVGKRMGELRDCEPPLIHKSGHRYANPSGRLADAYVLAGEAGPTEFQGTAQRGTFRRSAV